MAGTDLGLEGFGYGANAGNPMGFWRQGDNANKQGQLTNQQLQNAIQEQQYDFNAQKKADDALPSILMGLGQGGTMPMPSGGQQPPMPGQPSMPQQPTGPQGAPQGGPPPQQPPQMPPQMAMPSSGVSRMPSTAMPSTAMPSTPPPMPQGAGPNIQPMDQQQAPQGSSMPQVPGATPGYDLPSVIQAIKQNYPNIDGAALRKMLTTINPLILTPQARAQLQAMKMQMEYAKLPVQQENADSRRAMAQTGAFNAGSTYANRFGNFPQGMPGSPGQVGGQGGQMGPGAAQLPTAGMPQVRASDLNNSGIAPTAVVKGQNAMAAQDAKTVSQYDQMRPSEEQTMDALGHLQTMASSPDFSPGAGGTWSVAGANWLATITGDQNLAKMAAAGQIDQKAIADVITNKIASSGSGRVVTDKLKNFIEQTKPSIDLQPGAFKSVIAANLAQMQRQMLYEDFYSSEVQKNGLFSPQSRTAFEKAQKQYPLFMTAPDGTVAFKPENGQKFQAALEKAHGGEFSAVGVMPEQDDMNRPLTPEELQEYKKLGGK
jgi:hypothetical protein